MITDGYLARHSMGRSGMRDPALLDVAQDYALYRLHEEGFFNNGAVLKGGTSLRKFRAGNAGRFSTDLDFAVPDTAAGESLVNALDGVAVYEVAFRVTERDQLRGRLEVETPLGRPTIAARVEASTRPLWMACDTLPPIALPVHDGYEFELPHLPVPTIDEAIAEKVAAWRRRRKMRDLYDLHWLGARPLDESLVRKLTVLKIWHDVVDEGLGRPPFDPNDVVGMFDATTLAPEEIGLLTQPVEPERWAESVRRRYRFLGSLDADEERIARCDPRDRGLVITVLRNVATRERLGQ